MFSKLLATEGRATRQRPRLLLGRSVFSPHFNVALPIFQYSARSEVFDFLLFHSHSNFLFHLFNSTIKGYLRWHEFS